MKRILLPLLMLIAVFSFAQLSSNQENIEKFDRTINNKTATQGWYNYGRLVYDQGGDVSYFRNNLFPDSTVQVEFSNGMGYVWKHSMGQVLDPVAGYWLLNAPVLGAQSTDPYKVDSIAIWYRYFRHQTVAPDTLIIQLYKDDKLTKQVDPWGDGRSVAMASYDYMARIGSNATQTITYLLENKDTSTANQNAIVLPVNLQMGPDEKVATTITYIPGNPYVHGDTIDQYMATPPSKLINSFIAYEFRDNDKTLESGFYNHALTVTTDTRYNISQNGWNGSYIPGLAWNSGYYHLDMEYHVTPVVGITENKLELDVELYPNPSNGSNVTLYIDSKESKMISYTVFDVAGKEIFTATDALSASLNKITLPTASFNDGVYFVKINTAKQTLTKRLVIAK